MIFTKVLLYLIIFITSSLLGFAYGEKFSQRVKSLVELQNSIRLMQTEVTIFANPMPIALDNIAKKTSKNMKQLYYIILEDMLLNNSGDLFSSFLKATEYLKCTCLLKQQDIEPFLSLGRVIGKTDRLDQEQQFKYVLDEIEQLIVVANDEKTKNEKMYKSLGVLTGLGMIIILI